MFKYSLTAPLYTDSSNLTEAITAVELCKGYEFIDQLFFSQESDNVFFATYKVRDPVTN